MAKTTIKCPECGGVLTYDTTWDVLDCAACGAKFDAILCPACGAHTICECGEFIYCQVCGQCTHPDVAGSVCTVCRETVKE